MVEPVFLFEERRGMRIGLRRCAARCTVGHRIAMRMHALVQAMQIAASAERLFTGTAQHHTRDLRILGPSAQLRIQ